MNRKFVNMHRKRRRKQYAFRVIIKAISAYLSHKRSTMCLCNDLIEKTRGIWKNEIHEIFAIFFFFFLRVIPMRMNGKRWKL